MAIDLVTGGAGFIGSHLVDRLIDLGRNVRVVDNFASGNLRNLLQHKGNAALDVIQGDVSDAAVMTKAANGVERVFHVAALAGHCPVDPESRRLLPIERRRHLRDAAGGARPAASSVSSMSARRPVTVFPTLSQPQKRPKSGRNILTP